MRPRRSLNGRTAAEQRAHEARAIKPLIAAGIDQIKRDREDESRRARVRHQAAEFRFLDGVLDGGGCGSVTQRARTSQKSTP